jgi:hypothetical protein
MTIRSAVLFLALVTACSKDSAPTCAETIENINNALRASRGVPWGTSLDESDCKKDSYSAELRRCIAQARTEDAVMACAQRGPKALLESLQADRAVFDRNEELKKASKAAP